MLWLVLLKIRLARIAFAKRRAYGRMSGERMDIVFQWAYLSRDLLLLFSWEVDEMVVFGAN